MEEADKLAVTAAIIRQMKEEWPWLKRVYPLEGSPQKRDRCKRLNFELRPRIPVFDIPLEYYSGTRLPMEWAVLWVEWVRRVRKDELRAMVWIISNPPSGNQSGPEIQAGELPVNYLEGFHYAGALSNLVENFDRFLLPKNAVRFGQSELLTGCHYPCWRKQDFFALSESREGLRLLQFVVTGQEARQVNAQMLAPGSRPWARYEYDRPVKYSPAGGYVAWADEHEKRKVRCITALPDGKLIARIPLLEKQSPWAFCWINETQWVECRPEGTQLSLDFYDVHAPGKVETRSYSYNNPLVRDHAESLPLGTTPDQELLFHGSLRISLPGNRVSGKKINCPIPGEKGWPTMSPDGKWLMWYIQQDSVDIHKLDPNFKPYKIWTSRPDGSDARLVADMYRPLINPHAWQPIFYPKADSRAVYTLIGGNFGDSLYTIS